MQQADPLIRTKLRLPFTRSGLVSRPRLQEKICEGLRGPLTLVTAPAGFGKTTLIASTITTCGYPAAWLSLDKDDNRPGTFLSYLVAALQTADAEIGDAASQLLAAAQPATVEAVLTSLVNDLDATGGEIVLVLDDYQFIHGPGVHAAVVFLLEHLPNCLHIVIASRSDPALPLARLRARAQVVELRAADLRFTEPEAAQFLNSVMGLNLGGAPVAALAERTEGWIAGLQMAALSMHHRTDVNGFVASFSGTNRYILDYLLEEVLACQPPEVQHFLVRTSILERLTAPLCDALLDESESNSSGVHPHGVSASTLEYLEKANIFLTPLDDERIWYRYHHLFADLLRARLQQADGDSGRQLHIRASTWLEQDGLFPEAIQHLFAAAETERAADLIERYGPQRLADSDPSVIRMSDGLPAEMFIARPKIGLYQCWFLIIQGHIEKAVRLLNALQHELTRASSKPGASWMQTVVTLALAFLYPAPGTSDLDPFPDSQVLDAIPAEEPILRNAADFLYGMSVARRGDLDRAVEVALRCIQREKLRHGAPAIPTLAPFLTRIYLMQGRLHASAALCRELLNPFQEKGTRFVYTAGSIEIDLGEALCEWNRLEEAEQHIRDGLRANEPWQNIMTEAFGLIALSRVLQARGDYAGAMQTAEKLEFRLQELPRPREFEEGFRTLRACMLLAGGKVHAASEWAEQIQHSDDFVLHPERYRLALARIRLAQGRHAQVESLLAEKTLPAGPGSQITRQVEAKLLLAAAAAGQKRLAEAFRRLEEGLALAEPEGYLRVFLEAGEPARALLAAYLRSPAARYNDFAQKLLEAFSSPQPPGLPASQTAELIEPLSAREVEVLQLIAQGRTNPEIARELIVAPGTIKAHAASIYRKLDAANRTEAVAHARQLGILD